MPEKLTLGEFLKSGGVATPGQVADMLKCSPNSVCKWIRVGELQAWKKMRRGQTGRNPDRPGQGRTFIRISSSHLRAFLDSHETALHPRESIIPRTRAGGDNRPQMSPKLRFEKAVGDTNTGFTWPPKAPQRRRIKKT